VIVRSLSAIVAIILLIAVYYFFRETGLLVLCSFLALVGIFEFARLSFKNQPTPYYIQGAFFILSATIYFVVLSQALFSHLLIALCSCVFLAVPLFRVSRKEDLATTLQIQMAGLMGFVYVSLFPALVVKNLLFVNGLNWFLCLLSIVFAGDTFAYVSGRAFGKHKLLEAVSPKKTIEGSVGGLFGSMLAGAIFNYFWITEIPPAYMLGLALITGVFAQVGDLFESLLKRIADVKDSGSIMPGHGGYLDRVDGVYFAGPIYYILVFFMTQM
jgi:phosphatidate cytidylyltransferase